MKMLISQNFILVLFNLVLLVVLQECCLRQPDLVLTNGVLGYLITEKLVRQQWLTKNFVKPWINKGQFEQNILRIFNKVHKI